MTIVSEYFSDDGTRKTQIIRTSNAKERYAVKVWIGGVEEKRHEKRFANIDVAEWYAEEWVQK